MCDYAILHTQYFILINFPVAGNIAGIAVLLLLSAMAGSAKFAVFSLDSRQLKQIKETKDKPAQIILNFIQNPKELLAAFLFALTFFNLGVVILFENLFAEIIDNEFLSKNFIWILILKIIAETCIIILFAEIIPRAYGGKNPYSVSRKFIYLVYFLSKIFKPFTATLIASANLLETQLGNAPNNLTAADIDDAIDHATTDEHKKNNSQILKGLIKFRNITATQIMRSRIDMVAVDRDFSFKKLLETVKDSGYSRIPVYVDDIDKICGIIYAKDLLLYLDENDEFNWQQLIKPAFFVPDSKRINDLLEDFQNKRIHLAVVVDEYGGTLGIVTLEDVLEEVIGDIKDEFDDISEIDYKKIDNHNYVFEARTAINDVYKVLDIKDDIFDAVRGDADSLAGLMLEINNDIPKEGDELEYQNYKFIILEANETRVIRVKITINF